MWVLDYKENWVPKNWCFWTVVLEKTLGSPLDCKEIQPVHPKGDQSWVFIGGTDIEAETPILWPPDAESWLIGKDPDAGKDWGQEEKGTTEDEMVGWHHWCHALILKVLSHPGPTVSTLHQGDPRDSKAGDSNVVGTSLVVQRLGFCRDFHWRGHEFVPGQGTKSPHTSGWGEKKKDTSRVEVWTSNKMKVTNRSPPG